MFWSNVLTQSSGQNNTNLQGVTSSNTGIFEVSEEFSLMSQHGRKGRTIT
jgi:hypothetical protein